ncbi:MAG: PQQ-binding-like beta-propeller repeat protein [Candidatus Eremiobacteraeota bacterium]|nr:PQQ-binding-like beta-propeller repeat protein [Candidatus Eremiobacteraeota bacterium]
MEVRSLARALAALIVTSATPALARGEHSIPAQRTIVGAPASTPAVRAARWRRAVTLGDPRHPLHLESGQPPTPLTGFGWRTEAPVLVAGGGRVFASVGSRLCAFAQIDGRTLWCANGAAGRYTFAHGEVVSFDAGRATAFAATTGRRRWTARAARIVPTIAGFGAMTSSYFAELDPDGRELWRATVNGYLDSEPTAIGTRTMLLHTFLNGARFGDAIYLLTSGAGGGLVVLGTESPSIIGRDGARIVLAGGWRAQEVEDNTLTFEVDEIDVALQKLAAEWIFAPNYDENRGLMLSFFSTADAVRTRLTAAENGAIYASVLSRVYRYRLGPPAGQRPLLVSDYGRWVGGPLGGTLLIERYDGVWIVRVHGNRTVETRALVYPEGVRLAALAIADGNAYVATTGGAVDAFDARTGRRVMDARTGCRRYHDIVVESASVLFVCTDSKNPVIFAFPRVRAAS